MVDTGSYGKGPRIAVGDFLWNGMVMGVKAVRLALSSRYHTRVRDHWRIHPQYRWRNLGMMAFGLILDAGILVTLAVLLIHKSV
jgi:hypothetical protein